MKFVISVIGCGIIGIITSSMGFPIYDFETGSFLIRNSLLCLGLCLLWDMLVILISVE